MDILQAQRKAIRYFRKANGLTQKELGKRTMISSESIWSYEHFANAPLDKLENICSAFGIKINEFYNMVLLIQEEKDGAD